MLPQDLIRTKRDGGTLDAAQVQAFVDGLSPPDGAGPAWADSQVAAMAMAIVLRGMDTAETVALTRAMIRSGQVLRWDTPQDSGGPVLDKHSTGGVGDKVSLVLAPLLAACGARVPMISGRGLGHTGGTLDKLEALPGYTVDPPQDRVREALRQAGCAIVGASAALAPADRRLYAIRDLTATVESMPLITASILSKKLAAGLQGLVLDVKTGSGAFTPTLAQAQALAASLVQVARGAGLPARALITDMGQVLGREAGNALEVRESLDLLCRPAQAEPRLREVTLALAAELLALGGLAPDTASGRRQAEHALHGGAAAERFARMVRALGGPPDVLTDAQLPQAPVRLPVPAPGHGRLQALDVRALGQVIVALGGGRTRPGQVLDPRVGLAGVAGLGAVLQAGEPMAWVHAATAAEAERAVAAVQAAARWADPKDPAAVPLAPVVLAAAPDAGPGLPAAAQS